jgi:hypothetical protein
MSCPLGFPEFIIIINEQDLCRDTFGGFFAPMLRGAIQYATSNSNT